MYLVKDTTGQTFLAAFHYNDRTLFSEVWKKGLVGSTICVMYANFHQFVDGQVGARLEEPESVKVRDLTRWVYSSSRCPDYTGRFFRLA